VLGAEDRIALRRSYDPNESLSNAWIYVDPDARDGEVPQHPLVGATGSAEQLAAVKAFTLALAGWMDAPFVERRVGELPSGDPVTDVVELIASVGGLLGKLLD